MEQGTIVVVDDEPNIADLVELYLEREGFRVLKAGDRRRRPRRVPRRTGPASSSSTSASPTSTASRCASASGATSQIPVIFLTARDGEVDRVLGLELGADDYLTKPFSPAELVARVKAVLRRDRRRAARPRSCRPAASRSTPGAARSASDDAPSSSPPRSSTCCGSSPSARGSRSRRQQILDGVWGYDWFGDARTVDVHIAQVRKKLGDALTITTVRGVGYRLESGTARRTVSRPRRRLRTRLLVAMVAVAFGVLVVAALGAAGLARETVGRRRGRATCGARRPRSRAELEALGRAFGWRRGTPTSPSGARRSAARAGSWRRRCASPAAASS